MDNDKNYLEHHGVPGQRWGVRRYQNYDGSLKVAGKLKRAQTLKAQAGEYKKMAKTLKNPEDAIQKGKYEARAAKLAAKAEKFKDQYEKKYAKAYVRDLNKARKAFNKAYDKSSNGIVNNIAKGKGLSAETFLSGANLAATRFNYDQLKNKAISEIPSNTKYALELTSSGYKLRYKGEAAKVDGVTTKKVGEAVSGIKDVKDRKGIAKVTSGGLKSAMDLYDVVKVNSSVRPAVKKTKAQSPAPQNQNGQASAPSNNTSKIEKGVEIASTFTNSASNIQKFAVSISNAVKAVKKASTSKKEVSSIDNGATTKGKNKLDSILATSGTILSFAVPTVSIASQIIQTKNAVRKQWKTI